MGCMYDELRTQYSVLEAYSAKMDSKVSELEDLLDSMEHTQCPRADSEGTIPNFEEQTDDEVQKLRSENEWLREVIIRSTREDFTNFREDSIKIRSPREHYTILPTISKSILSPRATLDSIPPEEEKSESRKSIKMTNSFIRKQSSAKIIQKIKSHRSIDPRGPHDIASPTTSTATAVSTTSKRPLQAITETYNNKSNPDPQPESKSANQHTPNNTRSRRSVKCNDEIAKAPANLSRSFAQPTSTNTSNSSPPKAAALSRVNTVNAGASNLSRSVTRFIETNNENQVPANADGVKEDSLSSSAGSNCIPHPDIVQKMVELERVITGKDKAYETEHVELKRQLEEMRHTVVTLVTALSILTQRIA